MGVRVRGKATARPDEVGDPSLRVRTWCLSGTGIPRHRRTKHLACQTGVVKTESWRWRPDGGWQKVGKPVSPL
jgi:hypothetical protein